MSNKSKTHFDILDGLRGTAAILVVIFHLLEAIFPDPNFNPLHHAYLAVDFFFMLSGFVIGYAYDDRWTTMSIKDFFTIRLIRLHPMVLLGLLIGVLSYWLDPFVENAQQVDLLLMVIPFMLGLFLLPSAALPNRYEETHSLNGPCWSLLQEYLANIVYALIAPRLTPNALIIIVFFCSIPLTATAIWFGHLQAGWAWSNFWIAPVRTAFPFFTGLLLYRINLKIKIPFAYLLLSIVLLIVFALPYFKLNGVYEVMCIIIVFPLLVAAGAGSEISGKLKSICHFFGQISYPVYIIHYPFIYIYTHWIYQQHPSIEFALLVGAGLAIFFIVLAWLSLRLYDEPLRTWLTKLHKQSIRK